MFSLKIAWSNLSQAICRIFERLFSRLSCVWKSRVNRIVENSFTPSSSIDGFLARTHAEWAWKMENSEKKPCFPTKCGKHDPEFPPPARKSGNFGACLFFLFFNGVLMETLLPFSLARKWHTQSWHKKSSVEYNAKRGPRPNSKSDSAYFPPFKGHTFLQFLKGKKPVRYR